MSVSAQDNWPFQESERVARLYMEKYLQHDFTALESLMGLDRWFHDPVTETVWPRYYKGEGITAVLQLFSEVFSDMKPFPMKYDTVWFSPEFAFFEGELFFPTDGAWLGVPRKTFSFSMRCFRTALWTN